jgi:hypothetical protein
MKNYIVKCKTRNKYGTLTIQTLCESGDLKEATDTPMRFFNIKQAGRTATQLLDISHGSFYVEGPLGGKYSVRTGKNL